MLGDLKNLADGLGIGIQDYAKARPQISKLVIEPWMVDFARGRHSQEEWEAFFAYAEASPAKRKLIQWASWAAYLLGFLR